MNHEGLLVKTDDVTAYSMLEEANCDTICYNNQVFYNKQGWKGNMEDHVLFPHIGKDTWGHLQKDKYVVFSCLLLSIMVLKLWYHPYNCTTHNKCTSTIFQSVFNKMNNDYSCV